MSELLILEGEPMVGRILEHKLRREGYEVTWLRTAGAPPADRRRPGGGRPRRGLAGLDGGRRRPSRGLVRHLRPRRRGGGAARRPGRGGGRHPQALQADRGRGPGADPARGGQVTALVAAQPVPATGPADRPPSVVVSA